VARILAVVADLMLASRVEAPLRAAGHEVTVRPEPGPDAGGFDLIVADLEHADAAAVAAAGPPSIGFYPHTEVAIRQRAEAAGIDLAVPRSRMARELPELAAGMLERRR
jgi:hypothetical protein